MAEIKDPENTVIIELKDGPVVIELLADLNGGTDVDSVAGNDLEVFLPNAVFTFSDVVGDAHLSSSRFASRWYRSLCAMVSSNHLTILRSPQVGRSMTT